MAQKMNQNRLFEDKLLSKLPVGFSTEIIEIINDINWYNRNNIVELIQWHDYLDGLVNYISNPVIAWDNTNRFQHSSNGKTHISELGYEVTFLVKTNKQTHQSYVYIMEMNLNTEKFGLEQPSLYETQYHNSHQKTRIRLTESDLYWIIQECVNRVLNARY